MDSLKEIEHAIDQLDRRQLSELYAWLDQRRAVIGERSDADVFEQGLGMFGNPEDSATLDEVVRLVYAERRRPSLRAH